MAIETNSVDSSYVHIEHTEKSALVFGIHQFNMVRQAGHYYLLFYNCFLAALNVVQLKIPCSVLQNSKSVEGDVLFDK